ncbi:MAG: hypothetical protein RLZZ403_1000 [Pseudomonadota bacterium]|jgi:hypothetical protein
MTDHIHPTLVHALSALQGEIADPQKTKWNPHFKSYYADVQAGLEIVRPLLAKHGLAIVQVTGIADGLVIVTTRLLHTTGEWIEGTYPVGSVTTQQQTLMGNLTYARRAGLFGLIGIAPDDMDGEDAPAAEPAKAQNGASSRQQRATARSAEKAAAAPIQEAPAHDPQTGEVQQEPAADLLEQSASEAVKDEMIAKLETIGKSVTRAKLSVWSKQNKPLKDRLQPQHKKDVELLFKALNVAVVAAEAQQEGAPA